jgi:pimeloyl-ACP methyl ester carboxylesterase
MPLIPDRNLLDGGGRAVDISREFAFRSAFHPKEIKMKRLLLGSVLFALILFTAPLLAATGTVISADGVEIAYQTWGEAGNPAVLLSHCWSGDRTYWHRQVDGLAADHFVVALDLAGHGESGLGRQEYTMEAYGADVAAVVKHLELEKVVLVGHSMSGAVVIAAAALIPDQVIGLVGIDTLQEVVIPMTPEQVAAYQESLRPDFKGLTLKRMPFMFHESSDKSVVQAISEDMASAPPEVAIPSIGNYLLWDPRPALKKISAPIVCIDSKAESREYRGLGDP